MRMRLGWLGAMTLACLTGAAAGQVQHEQIRSAFNVEHYDLQQIGLPAFEGQAFDVSVNLGGVDYTLFLEPHSLRSSDFKVVEYGANGPVLLDPPAPRTYRGSVDGVPGAQVAASLLDTGLSAMVYFPGKTAQTFVIQGVGEGVSGAPAGLHVVYDVDDSLPVDGQCGNDFILQPAAAGGVPNGDGTGEFSTRVLKEAQVSFDSDFEFYQDNGSNSGNTVADIENVMNQVTITYERDLEITYAIGQIIVRSTASDPYSSSDAGTLLGQFQNYWNSNYSSGGSNIPRDMAHLMTGRNINGGTIGVAYLSQVCNVAGAYGLSERFTSNLAQRNALTSHEMGHNWSSPHCDGTNPCRIMCSGLGGCNGIGNPPSFAPTSISTITSFKNSRNCLTTVQPTFRQLPLFDNFDASGTLDANNWVGGTGASVNTGGVNEPSGTNAATFVQTSSLETVSIDVATYAGTVDPIELSFYWQTVGVEAGELLFVEYRDAGTVWSFLGFVQSTGSTDPFERFAINLPAQAIGNGYAFRLRAAGDEANDRWFIDDFSIGEPSIPDPTIMAPFVDTFPTTTLDPNIWEANTGAVVNTNGVNEPSAPNSLNLDSTDSAETWDVLLGGLSGTPLWFTFQSQHIGVENGEVLFVDYFSNTSHDWAFLTALASDGVDQAQYTLNQIPLPLDAYHNGARFRFRAVGNQADDDWYLDDVGVTDTFVEPPSCLGDWDNSGGQPNSSDFLAYLNDFSAHDPAADLAPTGGDGLFDSSDFLAYLNLYSQGC
ncbi:MAG: M12 family metallo-peptidase [Phycisphaerales bacterium]|jgi:hypothetical protein|nr:M12 family metallo-peptidase [Phycisphaerales bacterium]